MLGMTQPRAPFPAQADPTGGHRAEVAVAAAGAPISLPPWVQALKVSSGRRLVSLHRHMPPSCILCRARGGSSGCDTRQDGLAPPRSALSSGICPCKQNISKCFLTLRMIPDLIFNAIDFLGSHTFACCDLPATCPAAGAGQEPAASGGWSHPELLCGNNPGVGGSCGNPRQLVTQLLG